MSGVTYWLQKQRKGELIELARDVGMTDYANLLKTDLEVALEEHLRANQSTLSHNPVLEPYYKRIASPLKREASLAAQLVATGGEIRKGGAARARRQTRGGGVEESDAFVPLSLPTHHQCREADIARKKEGAKKEGSKEAKLTPHRSDTTPGLSTPLAPARRLPLPPSPAHLADRIDASTRSLTSTLSSTISRSPLPHLLTSLRTSLSSVLAVHLLILALEAWGLRAQVLPLRYLGTAVLPLVGGVGVKAPDMFMVLRGEFWGPVALWVGGSVIGPGVGGWVVNFKRGEGERGENGGREGWRVDPLVFSLVKGLLAWVVYGRNGWGGESRAVVVEGVPGGVVGMMVGAGVGMLVSLWEGIGR